MSAPQRTPGGTIAGRRRTGQTHRTGFVHTLIGIALLAVLLWRAVRNERVALLGAVAYAATDELHQAFVRGRHASPIDVAIDGIGAAAGLALLLHVRGTRAVR